MSDIRFYHLERQTLDQALPALLSKALSGGHRIVVKTADPQDVERLNTHLWTYDPNSFLPHGSAKDGHAEHQPVWLTTEDENPNEADVLILINGCESAMVENFTLCCEMLDGNNPESVSRARTRWKSYKDTDHSVTYWKQGDQGWQKAGG